jgi:hypothetical protein
MDMQMCLANAVAIFANRISLLVKIVNMKSNYNDAAYAQRLLLLDLLFWAGKEQRLAGP